MSQAFEAAKALHAAGNLKEAMTAYRRVPAEDPDHYRALNNLGLLLEGEGRLLEASDVLDQAMSARSDSAILHCNRARILHRQGHLAEAVAGYRRAIELDPSWVDPHHNLAMAHEALGDLQEAETSYRRTLELEPRNVAAHRHLGDILFDSGRVSAALPHYHRALEIDPSDARAHFDLAKALTALGSYEKAVESYRRCLDIEPRSGPACQNFVSVLGRLGHIDEARSVLERWVAFAPGDPVPRHMLAAITGEGVPQRATDETVRDLFDEFAASFDSTLSRLDYQAPQLVFAAVTERYPDAQSPYQILDAGCGTGLCGVLLRPRAKRLVGVDLSAGMLAKARERGVYDELVEGELTGFLQGHPDCYDIIASADTLNYFGVLDGVLRAAADALRTDGHLVFTLECDSGPEHEPWRLQPNGRYSHAEEYVRSAIRDAGLNLVSLRSGVLRREGTEAVRGWIVTANRGASDRRAPRLPSDQPRHYAAGNG